MENIAILLATCNGENYISEFLRSLELQTCQDFVCYVHDDGSSDRTRELLLDYVIRSPQQFVILDYPPTGSAKANFFSLLSKVEAQYYFLADQDDVWLPEKLEQSLYAMESLLQEELFIKEQSKARKQDFSPFFQNPSMTPLCVFSDMVVVGHDMEMVAPSFHHYIGRDPYRLAYQQILVDNPAAGCTMFFNHALRDRALQYTDIDEIEMHDAWLLLLASILGRVRYIPTPLVCYRQHGNNIRGALKQEGVVSRVTRNLRDIMDGSFVGRKAEFHERMRLMARQALAVEGIPKDVKKTLTELVGLSRRSRAYRMRFYKKNGFIREHNDFWFRLTG